MDKRIKLLESLAKEKRILRQNFLIDRDERNRKQKEQEVAAKPIVEPIVKALANTKQENSSLTENEVRRLISRVQQSVKWNNRGEFLNKVHELYFDDNIFNTFLSMAQMKAIDNFPTAKMYKLGVVDSLIFYGMRGTNLDHLPGIRQTSEFKERLNLFKKFNNQHSQMVKIILKEDDDELQKQHKRNKVYTDYIDSSIMRQQSRKLPITPVVSDDDDDYSGNEESGDEESGDSEETFYKADLDDTLTEGSGLKSRLAMLHASKNAGNTSLKLKNEAHAIVKHLLKTRKIDKKMYVNLAKLF